MHKPLDLVSKTHKMVICGFVWKQRDLAHKNQECLNRVKRVICEHPLHVLIAFPTEGICDRIPDPRNMINRKPNLTRSGSLAKWFSKYLRPPVFDRYLFNCYCVIKIQLHMHVV